MTLYFLIYVDKRRTGILTERYTQKIMSKKTKAKKTENTQAQKRITMIEKK